MTWVLLLIHKLSTWRTKKRLLLNWQIIIHAKAELDQMLCGLAETLGTLDLLRSNPGIMHPLLVATTKPPLSAMFCSLFETR